MSQFLFSCFSAAYAMFCQPLTKNKFALNTIDQLSEEMIAHSERAILPGEYVQV